MVTTVVAPALIAARPRAVPAAVRRLLIGYFAGLGVMVAIWGARMPAVQAAARLSPGRLSQVLLAVSVSMVAGSQLGGRLAHRYGPAPILSGPAAALGLAMAVLGLCRSQLALTAAATLFGLILGLLIVATNAAAVTCQDAYGRPIMSSLHASYSVGALGGAALAAGTAPLPHATVFAVTGAAFAITALATAPMTRSVAELGGPGATHTAVAPSRPTSAVRPRVWLLGALAAACLLGEGAAGDWSAVHAHALGASSSVAALAYALYSGAMAVGRLAGDRLTARYGPAALVRTGAGLAAAGLGAGLAIGTVPSALAGWTALGLGLSAVIPALYTAAGRSGPRAVASVATIGNVGMLAGPAAIGALASISSLPTALDLPVVLALAVAAAAPRSLKAAR